MSKEHSVEGRRAQPLLVTGFVIALLAAGALIQNVLGKTFAALADATPSAAPPAVEGAPRAAREWPGDSLYHADVAIETSTGALTSFAASGGGVRIVTMLYASCPMACPLIIDTLQRIDRELTPSQRSKLGVLMVTLDPQNDTPAALSELAGSRGIDERRWMLGRAAPADTRKLAGALGIQYRQLDDGSFNHSSTLVLLDAEGRVLARSGKMGAPDPAFIAAVRDALR